MSTNPKSSPSTGEAYFNLSGCVRNLGLPVTGLSVRVHRLAQDRRISTNTSNDYVSCFKITTDSRGNFQFSLPQGFYDLEVISEKNNRFINFLQEDIELNANTTINVSMKTGNIVEGKVIAPKQIPAQSLCLRFFEMTRSESLFITKVRDDGSFSITLPRGTFLVQPCHKPNNFDPRNEAISAESSATKQSNFSSIGLLYPSWTEIQVDDDRKLEIDLGQIHCLKGSVINAGHRSIAGAQIEVKLSSQAIENDKQYNFQIPREAELSTILESDSEGNFSVFLRQGKYCIFVDPHEQSGLCQHIEDNYSINQDQELELVLSKGITYSGEITLPENLKNKNFHGEEMEILAMDSQGKVIGKGKPNDNLSFSFTAPKNISYLAIIPGLKQSHKFMLAPNVLSVEGLNTENIKIELKTGSKYKATLHDLAGKPKDHILIAVIAGFVKPEFIKETAILSASLSDGSGNFSFNLSSGTYQLVLKKSGDHSVYTEEIEHNQNQIQDNVQDLVHELVWNGNYEVSFTISDEDYKPVANCKVSYGQYGTNNLQSQFSDHSGYLKLYLPAGIYTFSFEPNSSDSLGRQLSEKVIRQLSVSTDLNRTVKLSDE